MSKIKKEKYTLIFTLIICIYHILMRMNSGDDVWFSEILANTNMSLIEFLVFRWNNWTSRVIIEGLMIPFTMCSPNIWKILNIFIWVLLFYSLSELLDIKRDSKYAWVLICLIMMYPFTVMASAGWIATTMNYIWPLSFGMYSFTLVKDVATEKSISKIKWMIRFIFSIFAVNQEQIGAIVFVILLLAIIYFFYKRKKWYVLIPNWCLACANLGSVVICPGNVARVQSETETWFPEFADFSLLDKLYLGYVHMMNHFLEKPSEILFIFVVTVFILSFPLCHKLISKVLATFPVTYLLFLYIYTGRTGVGILASTLLGNYEMLNLMYFLSSLLFWGILLFQSVSIMDSRENRFFMFLCLCAGIAASWIIGFSPTIYVSGDRTLLFQYVSLIIAEMFILIKKRLEIKKIVFYVGTIYSIGCMAFRMLYIYRI